MRLYIFLSADDPGLLENDIILSPVQASQRNFNVLHRFLRWSDNTVVYKIDSAYSKFLKGYAYRNQILKIQNCIFYFKKSFYF